MSKSSEIATSFAQGAGNSTTGFFLIFSIITIGIVLMFSLSNTFKAMKSAQKDKETGTKNFIQALITTISFIVITVVITSFVK